MQNLMRQSDKQFFLPKHAEVATPCFICCFQRSTNSRFWGHSFQLHDYCFFS